MADPIEPAAPPFLLSPNPWERRLAEAERVLAEKNRLILELQEQLERKGQRLKEALALLREAERTTELQARRASLPEGRSPGADPSVLARLASEKSEGEIREKKLRQQLLLLQQSLADRDRVLKGRDGELQSARQALATRSREIQQLGERLKAGHELVQELRRDGEREIARVRAEISRIEEHSSTEAQGRHRLEELRSELERQAELYRKNLVQSEQTLKVREGEMQVLHEERQALLDRVASLQAELAAERETVLAMRSRLVDLESRAKAAADGASRASAQLAGAQTALQSAREECQDLRTQLESRQRRLEELEARRAQRDQEHAALLVANRSLETTLAEARTVGDAARTRLEHRLRTLEEELARRDAALSQLREGAQLADENALGSLRLALLACLRLRQGRAPSPPGGPTAGAPPEPASAAPRPRGALARLFSRPRVP